MPYVGPIDTFSRPLDIDFLVAASWRPQGHNDQLPYSVKDCKEPTWDMDNIGVFDASVVGGHSISIGAHIKLTDDAHVEGSEWIEWIALITMEIWTEVVTELYDDELPFTVDILFMVLFFGGMQVLVIYIRQTWLCNFDYMYE